MSDPKLADIKVSLIGEADLIVAQRQAVAEDKSAVEQLKADIEVIHSGVADNQSDIASRHTDIITKHQEIASDQAEVASNKASVVNIQEDISGKQSLTSNAAAAALISEGNAATSESNASASEASATQSELNAALSESNAALSENNAAISANAAATSEGNAASSAIAAANSTSVAASSESAAAISANAAAASEAGAAASKNTAASSATSAHNSASAADSSAALAVNSANAAATSETNAANSATAAAASENNAAASEISASGSASSATNSASAAATSESNTAASENQASASASAASISESNAATSEDKAAISANSASTAAITARTEADRSKSEADKTVAINNVATTAKNEAVQAKQEALAIVYNGEFSQLPTPGASAVADSKGYLDIGWTPLLAMMYPYSGIIGSPYKNDVFDFGYSGTHWSNRFQFKTTGIAFNIAGRFVKTAVGTVTNIHLPEAESTQERSVAFDDVFLDWNGNIQTHRSVNPHQTPTGFDRDAIADEHGYQKVQTGLYQQGDTYALLLGRVTRRNQGAYHPEFNTAGTRQWYAAEGIGRTHWYSSTLGELDKASCFDIQDGVFDHPHIQSGNLTYPNNIGRPGTDNKPYDAIYSDDFCPLFYSAKHVVDRQALLTDCVNRAVAGETFSGAQGQSEFVPLVTCYGCNDRNYAGYTYISDVVYHNITGEGLDLPYHTLHQTDRIQNYKDQLWGGNQTDFAGVTLYVYGHETGTFTSIVANSGESGSSQRMWYIAGTPDGSTDSASFINYLDDDNFQKLKAFYEAGNPTLTFFANITSYGLKNSVSPGFLMVDIIGAADSWPEEWKTRGAPGHWLAVGEEGESLIPDRTTKKYKLSRKCMKCYQVLKTTDNGVTWVEIPDYAEDFESKSNAIYKSLWETDCIMVFYRASANPFARQETTKIVTIGQQVYGTHAYDLRFGNHLAHCLMGKSLVGSTGDYSQYVPMKNSSHYLNSGNMYTNRYASRLSHEPLSLNSSAKSPAIKIWPHLQYNKINNTFELLAIFKEIKWLNSVCGDNSEFRDVLKLSPHLGSVTDLNNEQVLAGQKCAELPYQYDGSSY